MYLGVVAKPVPSKEFDGKIYLTRVSKTKVYQQRTHSKNFDDHAATNAMIWNGEWHSKESGLIVDGMTLGDLRITLAKHYQLEEEVANLIVIKFYRKKKATSATRFRVKVC